jgi:aryl-alcohol dehydrogenase-like predicted oxidoreductase
LKYRTLGKTGLKVGVIGLGTWQYGGEWAKEFSQEEVTAIIRRAAELGVNLLDTAECYGDHTSEQFIGAALKELGTRDHFVIATKFGHKFHGPFHRTDPRTPADIAVQLEDSLRALQTDRIDLYQYHSWSDADFESTEVRGFLEKAQAAGKILHIGNSIGPNDKTIQVEKSPAYHVTAIQIIYNRLSRAPEDTVFPVAERLKLGVLARVPLASGFLSGKYKPGATFPETDIRSRRDTAERNARLAEVQKIEQTELPAGMPMAQWALAWCLKSPAVQSVIPGCKSVEQLENNAAAAELDLVDPKHPWAAK